jgi:thiol-disulfide isomerase/thioredoxin
MTSKKWFGELPLFLLFLLLALLLHLLPGFFIAVCRAQGSTPHPQGLPLGEPVPGYIPLQLVNAPRTTATVADYRGRLLLLDFYATWCSSSRAPLPRLDSLQQEFGDSLQILLVSYRGSRDTEASVKTFLKEWRTPAGARLRLPSAVKDTTLIKLFPHRRIPHFAWIAPDGTLQAITGQALVTAANIRHALRTGRMPPSMREDVDLDRPLYSEGIVVPEARQQYSMLLQGQVDDGPSRSQLRQQDGQLTGMVLVNTPLLRLYESVKRRFYPVWGSWGLELDGVDSAAFFPEKSTLSRGDWNARHLYAYDLQVPPATEQALYELLFQDLNRYSGYHAAPELRETECLVLLRKGRKDRLRSRGGPAISRLYRLQNPDMQHMPLETLVERLNSNRALPKRVIDETGYTHPVDIAFPAGFGDLPTLRRQLKAYGLDLVPAKRQLPVLVLRPGPVVTAGRL